MDQTLQHGTDQQSSITTVGGESVALCIYRKLIEANEDPDQRHQLLYSAIVALQQDLLHIFSDSVSPVSADASARCAAPIPTARLLMWLSILLKGVRDPWSTTRKLCLKHMGPLIEVIGKYEKLQTLHTKSLAALSSRAIHNHKTSRSTAQCRMNPAASSKVSTPLRSVNAVAEADDSVPKPRNPSHHRDPTKPVARKNNGTVRAQITVTGTADVPRPSTADTQQAADGALCFESTKDVFLSDAVRTTVCSQWAEANFWYEKEGLLRVWVILQTHHCTSYGAAGGNIGRAGAWAHWVLMNVGFASLTAPQLPVREAAVDVIRCIAETSTHIASFTVYHTMTLLRMEHAAMKEGALCHTTTNGSPTLRRSSLHAKEDAKIYAIEGHLQLLVNLAKHNLIGLRTRDAVNALVLAFADAQAASIRQNVAEVLGTPSDDLYSHLLRYLVDSVHSAEKARWQQQETLLMALQRQLLNYLSQKHPYRCSTRRIAHLFHVEDAATVALNSQGSSENGRATSSLLRQGDFAACVLKVLLECACDQGFEVARMGRQVLPLFLQWLVRYDDSVESILLAIYAMRSSLTSPSAEQVFAELLVPYLWWFLAIRWAIDPNVWAPVAAAIQSLEENLLALCRQDSEMAVLLILVTYFAPALKQPGPFIELLMQPRMWSVLLQERGPASQYLHVGLDLIDLLSTVGVSTVHLVPTWLQHLRNAVTHHQCIVLGMTREAIIPSLSNRPRTMFPVVYCPVFAAPAMMDGGEDLLLGYTWLRMVFPTAPQRMPLQPLPMYAGETSHGSLRTSVLEAAGDAIDSEVCHKLYISSDVERDVIRGARSVMVEAAAVALPTRGAGGSHGMRVCVLEALIGRLDAVCPQWVQQENSDDQPLAAATAHSWDWDDDGSSDGVEGILMEEERAEAAAAVRHLCVDATVVDALAECLRAKVRQLL